MKFWKYSSAGNDFILFDRELELSSEEIEKICHRRFGIGADGVLMFGASSNPSEDFDMIYYNADGGEVEMCGNGARALCHFAKNVKGIKKDLLSFRTKTGIYRASFLTDSQIKMEMTEVSTPSLDVSDFGKNAFYLEVGVPHVVLLGVEYNGDLALKIRHDKRFTNGVNINFAKKTGEASYEIRTFERGVESETLACGTGVTALGVSLFNSGIISPDQKVQVQAAGGSFYVEREGEKVFLTGETELVFEGELPKMKL